MEIRDARAGDRDGWLRLWDGYVQFYEAQVAREVTDHTWERILDSAQPLVGRVAERDGRLVGMSVSVIHEATWSKASTLYLEDLFVDPQSRGGGIGQALLEDVVAQAKAHGCDRVYWHTRAGNEAARRLYDRFAPADDFVRYRIALADAG